MATDTITVKFKLEAEFETIQTIRRLLNDPTKQHVVTLLLTTHIRTILEAYGVGLFNLSSTVQVSRYRETNKGGRVPPPVLQDGLVTVWDYELDRKIETIEVEGPAWVAWLEEASAKSFRYEAGPGAFTAIKENRQGRAIWYAHKRIRGQLKRLYLGKSETLTAQKLAEAGRKMAQSRADLSH